MRFLALFLIACGGTPATRPPTAAAAEDSNKGATVVTWKDGSLTLGQIEERVSSKLNAMEQEYQLGRYELLNRSMNAAIDDALLKAEAKRRDLPDTETLLRETIEKQVQPPSEDVLKAFYEEVKPQLRGAPYEAVEQMLAGEWMQREMGARYEAMMTELRAAANIEGAVPYPDLKRVEVEVLPTDPVLGDAKAPVTIVQFAEYQCYYCNKVQPTLDSLLADYKGKVKLVYKDFPLENHQRALPAAVAARCAGEQGKYWEMSRVLLGNQQALTDEDFGTYASQLSLDVEKFETCRNSGEMEPLVRAGFTLGQEVGVAATPTFYVNGLLVSGAQPYDQFKAIIEQELKN